MRLMAVLFGGKQIYCIVQLLCSCCDMKKYSAELFLFSCHSA